MTESRLLPTQLGNDLRAAEDRAGQRYGLETVAAWPRLYPHLSEPLASTQDRIRDQLDGAARLCVLLVPNVVSATVLLTDAWWLLVPAAIAVLSWLLYRSATQAAVAYGKRCIGHSTCTASRCSTASTCRCHPTRRASWPPT
jgi:hypothetical protein